MGTLPANVVARETPSCCEDLRVTIPSTHAVFHALFGAWLRKGRIRRIDKRAERSGSIQNSRFMNEGLARVLQAQAVRILHAAYDNMYTALISRRVSRVNQRKIGAE